MTSLNTIVSSNSSLGIIPNSVSPDATATLLSSIEVDSTANIDNGIDVNIKVITRKTAKKRILFVFDFIIFALSVS